MTKAKKPGRPPLGKRPLSNKEKKARYRQRLSEVGRQQAYFALATETLDQMDEMVAYFGLQNRTELLEDIIKDGLGYALRLMRDLKQNEPHQEAMEDPEVLEAVVWARRGAWNDLFESKDQ